MITIIIKNKETRELNYTESDTLDNALAYFKKYYAERWTIDKIIEGETLHVRL